MILNEFEKITLGLSLKKSIDKKKDNIMCFVSLVAVAIDFIDKGNHPTDQLTGQLAEAMKVYKNQQSQAAATELVTMLNAVESYKKDVRRQLRSFRKAQLAEQKN